MADPEKFVEWTTGQPMALVEATNSVFRTSSSQSVGLVPSPPNPPVNSFLRDDATWVTITSAVSAPAPTTRLFTTVGTQEYNYPNGCVALWIRIGGGGGPGGGVDGGAAGVGTGAGGGGGTGGIGEILFTVASISTTVTIVVGAAGVQASTTVGTDGGDSSFGIYITASGGSAGQTVVAVSNDAVIGLGGNRGNVTGVSVNGGEPGGAAVAIFLATGGLGGFALSGQGGSPVPYGSGGRSRVFNSAVVTTVQNGNAAIGLAAGGGGGLVTRATAANEAQGGAATDGFVYIMEIYGLTASI